MATFKSKMKHLDPDWADRIWAASGEMNGGKGAAWRLAAAALAVTGARPASLERGIKFDLVVDGGVKYVRATVPGAKLLKNPDGTPRRGQDKVQLMWRVTKPREFPFREKEFMELCFALEAKHKDAGSLAAVLEVSYDKDALASNIRQLSKTIWPRRTKHVSPICYREMFAAQGKATGLDPAKLAAAMGHVSTESQGRYHAYRGKARSSRGRKPVVSLVCVPTGVKTERTPMARFRAAASLKKRLKGKKIA